ncbi:MAG: DnaJ domain-containing protein [Jaaginema sp. PMC 1079.18]|nr:DnaJ domain-containing protein [Jaaginema sp. PMC 1080.18]MEC4852591.1 DnaJ domain-containing protein [Jaaginema sp. PMC 1079.18]MEC4868343.1 DnaJ domain-containing protein [Jaaginema sp. PMC 1078.18]
MRSPNHYEILGVQPNASPTEIKQAYRHLVKQFHPDSQTERSSHETIVRLNAAYEVLGDSQRRRHYDREINPQTPPHYRPQQTAKDADAAIQRWFKQVYLPVSRVVVSILQSLNTQIEALSADPFDDVLMGNFQEYLEDCRESFNEAQRRFRSQPNPATVAGTAANLYYCLNQMGDGLNELEWFSLNYDEHYLHAGQEMFRIAERLRREAAMSARSIVV